MAGISSRAAGGIQNRKLFNDGNELQSKEFSDGSGLELYDATYRMYDAQLGRFHQIDPLADLSLSWSTYVFASDNPISRNDPLGLKDGDPQCPDCPTGKLAEVKQLAEVVVTGVKKKVNNFIGWFNGSSVGYTGSGWGHGPRRWMADKIGLTGYANNLFELGLHSQLQSSQVTLGGDLLEKIKNDPAMVKFQNDIIKMLKADPRFKKLGFVLADRKVVEFGGKRAPGDMVAQIKDPFNPAYADTWKVAGNELTWAVRHATVTFTALAKADGVIVIGYKLNDSFDLSAQGGRSGAYNTVSSGAGFLYHNVAGGNSSLQVNVWWDATIK
jgi:RHS repeat-associated protein